MKDKKLEKALDKYFLERLEKAFNVLCVTVLILLPFLLLCLVSYGLGRDKGKQEQCDTAR